MVDEEELRALREGYRPTSGDRPAPDVTRDDPATQLERVIADGLEEGERLAPTSREIAKMFIRVAPVFGQFVDERVATHEYRRQLDDDFWTMLSEDPNWGGKTARELRKRHGKRVGDLSVDLFVDPRTRQTRPEYLNDPEKALHLLKGALEKELNVVAEDAPKPKGRAATGDRPGMRSATTSEAELQKTIAPFLGGRR